MAQAIVRGHRRLQICCLLLLSFASCNQLFWRDASLGSVIVLANPTMADDPSFSLEVTVNYQEKNSWDPTFGTTLKRGYQTLLTKKGKNPAQYQFKGWVLSDSVTCSKTCSFLGGHSDEYGVNPIWFEWKDAEPRPK